jgi:uncharacterized secreted repeat protein (TIGR03808 family)
MNVESFHGESRSETVMDRRMFLSGALGVAALSPAAAAAAVPSSVGAGGGGAAPLRRTLNANEYGVEAGSADNQSPNLQRLVNDASAANQQIFLPPGRYVVSNLTLPQRTRLHGIPGATMLVFGGNGHMMVGENADIIELIGLTIDGANAPLADYVPGLVHIANAKSVTIENCDIRGSAKIGLALDRSAGRVYRNTITGAAEAGIRAIESTGLSITDNVVADCANGGILVWRWTEGEDGTIVSGNRVERIAAAAGGTGENGNGINIFRAHSVIVSGNRVADCAFTAVRANSANNVHITGNNCSRLGEVGIYSEFSFEGAMIANNVVDKAATGISVTNFNEGGHLAVISGNIVRNLTGKGPYPVDPPGFGVGIGVEADAAATGNVIDGAPLYGMALGWGPYLRDVAATGNVIRRAPVGIAVSVVKGTGSAMVSDNLISGATRGAILGMRWSEKATGDLAQSGADEFPNLMIARNRVG